MGAAPSRRDRPPARPPCGDRRRPPRQRTRLGLVRVTIRRARDRGRSYQWAAEDTLREDPLLARDSTNATTLAVVSIALCAQLHAAGFASAGATSHLPLLLPLVLRLPGGGGNRALCELHGARPLVLQPGPAADSAFEGLVDENAVSTHSRAAQS
jgi:hypothetical protein